MLNPGRAGTLMLSAARYLRRQWPSYIWIKVSIFQWCGGKQERQRTFVQLKTDILTKAYFNLRKHNELETQET